jgi:hypothetical protein
LYRFGCRRRTPDACVPVIAAFGKLLAAIPAVPTTHNDDNRGC